MNLEIRKPEKESNKKLKQIAKRQTNKHKRIIKLMKEKNG